MKTEFITGLLNNLKADYIVTSDCCTSYLISRFLIDVSSSRQPKFGPRLLYKKSLCSICGKSSRKTRYTILWDCDRYGVAEVGWQNSMTQKLESVNEFSAKKDRCFQINYLKKERIRITFANTQYTYPWGSQSSEAIPKCDRRGMHSSSSLSDVAWKMKKGRALELVRSNLDRTVNNYSSKNSHPIVCNLDNFRRENDFLVLWFAQVKWNSHQIEKTIPSPSLDQ